MKKQTTNAGLQESLKSADTEEWIDLLFYRPIGYQWALLFRQLGVSPNAITIASIFLGVAAGLSFYSTNLWLNVTGMCLLVWANMYDSADGQLARMTGQKSELGRMLDGVSGDFWFIAIYVAICFRLTPEWSFWIWLLAAGAGICHSKQAAMADYYRNIHLFFLKGKSGSELDNSVQQWAIYHSLSWKKDFVRKLFLWFYSGYTHSQEQLSPRFQQFFALLKKQYGEAIPATIGEQFRPGSLPLMKYTNILSFNTRVMVLFIALLVNLPWIYFVFELTILNGILVYMIWKQESWSKERMQQLNTKE
ncbi:MAG: CDP-alcohol phosphatidyltransferase family protein [Bacteroides sp.]